MELELQVAILVALARIADWYPGAFVPDHHFACSVLLRGDGPLKLVVRDGMVLGLDGHAFVGRVVARALRDGPAEHHSVEFEAKVVVQPRRPVFLDDELQAARRRFAALGRFRRDGEDSLVFVGCKWGDGCHGPNVSGSERKALHASYLDAPFLRVGFTAPSRWSAARAMGYSR